MAVMRDAPETIQRKERAPRKPDPFTLSDAAIIMRWPEDDMRMTQRRRPGVAPSFTVPRDGAGLSRIIFLAGLCGAFVGLFCANPRERCRQFVTTYGRLALEFVVCAIAIAIAVVGGANVIAICAIYLIARHTLVWTSEMLAGCVPSSAAWQQIAFWSGLLRDPVWLAAEATLAPPERPLAQVSDDVLLRLMIDNDSIAARDELAYRARNRPRLPR